MEFKLNEYHRNVPDEEFLEDLQRVAKLLNRNTLTQKEYQAYGMYHPSTIINRFGGWNAALNKAGLDIAKGYNRNKNNIDVTNEELLEDIRKVSISLNQKTVISSDYDKHGKHGRGIVIFRFGSWEKALREAGLEETGFHHHISDDELMKEIERIWILLGRQPTTTDIRKGISKYSLAAFSDRYGGWRKALEAFVEYVNNESDDENSETEEIEIEPDANMINQETANPNTDGQDKKYTRKTAREVNLRLRFRVMQRDNFKCCICGASPAKDPSVELHIDHIIPWSKGGETVMDNLQTLCSKCNLGKSDLL